MIKVSNISTEFDHKKVHDNISLEIREGEIFGILGRSGSGKTTLLRQIIMLDEIQHGNIKVLGYDIKHMNFKNREYLKKNWGVLFQFGALFSSMNVLDNIGFLLKENSNLPQDIINKIAATKLNMVGLDPSVGNLYPEELSGGMKKRVALARSLALDPKLLFLDEPTSGLDPASAKAFNELILELRDMLDLTVIIITHDLSTIEHVLDRFVILYDAKVAFLGNYTDALNTNNATIKKFLEKEDESGTPSQI
jgi:phospholipid/cholesterol/gamma-HCH transport system ATP-binding protein